MSRIIRSSKEQGELLGYLTLAKWIIAGPEIARMLENFEDSFNDEVKGNDETKDHENTASFEKMFRKDFEALKKEFSRVGNPFEDDSEQMYTIVSRNIMGKSSSQSVCSARRLGQEQYHQYTTDVLVLGKKSIYDTIKGNKLPLYRSNNKVVVSKIRQRVTSLKQDCHLFLSLYVACQRREGDLHQFFSNENHAYPPALSVHGELRNSDTKFYEM